MTQFNFDPTFFRRIISHSSSTERIPSLTQLTREAIEAFYDEFDYYPEIGVYAPGVFTILGDHMEYPEANLVQAALPYGTVIVGKSLNTVKCKVATTAKHVDGFKKTVFPINYFKNKNLQVYPHWVTFLRGVIKSFPCKDLKGFDALIHSSIPNHKGCGSSAALQVALYSFLEATCGNTSCKNKKNRGELCREAEMLHRADSCTLGVWDNVTSSLAEECTAILLNCTQNEISTVDIRDIDILFLLTYPNFNIELDDRNCIRRRDVELKLIARLLGLDHIKKATEKHLKILEKMEDPTRETVINILRSFEIDEDSIFDFVDELFTFPKSVSDLLDVCGEDGEFYHLCSEEGSRTSGIVENPNRDEVEEDTKVHKSPCRQPDKERKVEENKKLQRSPNYLDERLNELCKERRAQNEIVPIKICEEINCLGGIESLSKTSDMSIMGRLLRRLRHVITEKNRCDELPEILDKCDYVEFGNKLIQSHLSLKLDYQISCPTLDSLVMLAVNAEDVYGAKMISGGGTLTLLHRRAVEEFIKTVKENFDGGFTFHLVFPSSGADILNIGIKSNPKSMLSNRYLNREELMRKAVHDFDATYRYKPTHGAFSPGVVNLVGDHADYNHGFSISLAVSLLTIVVGAFNGTSKVRIVTTGDVHGEPQKVIIPLSVDEDLTAGKIKWVKLIKGVISRFQDSILGFDCLIESNIPCSTGISNQAVLVMAFYTFLEELTGEKTEDLCKKARNCMHVQQDFGNLSCGVGDPTVSIRTKQDYVILLDCRSLTSTAVPFQDTSVSLLMSFTSQAPADIRCLLFSRMEECYKVARTLGAKTLRCLNIQQLEAADRRKISETALRRAKHVVLENERVLRSVEALKNNDFEYLGELMVASHNSLRYNFEVTTPELDFLVERAMEVDGVLGSKMHCSGNSSCIITLVKRWAVDDVIEYLENNYCEKLDSFVVTPYEGCGSLNVKQYVENIPGPQFVFEDVFPF